MSNSFFPTQIGFIPTGTNGTANTSTLYLGSNATTTWEAIGFGQNGRPDYLQTLYLNLTKLVAGVPTLVATISIDVADVQAIIAGDSNATAPALQIKMREVAVCDAGIAKKMIVLGSSTYI